LSRQTERELSGLLFIHRSALPQYQHTPNSIEHSGQYLQYLSPLISSISREQFLHFEAPKNGDKRHERPPLDIGKGRRQPSQSSNGSLTYLPVQELSEKVKKRIIPKKANIFIISGRSLG
jgi:hypothetical protein